MPAGVRRSIEVTIDAIDDSSGTDEVRTVGTPAGNGICAGDSGGPAFVEQDGESVQILAHRYVGDCDLGRHTRLGPYLDWMQGVMGDDLLTRVALAASSDDTGAVPTPSNTAQPAACGCRAAGGMLGWAGVTGAFALWMLSRRRRLTG